MIPLPMLLTPTMLTAVMLTAVAFGQGTVPSGGSHGAAVDGTLRNGSTNEDISNRQQESYGQSAEPPDPQSLLEEALRTLETRSSVTARIRQEIDLFGKRLVGSGNYLEKRPDSDSLRIQGRLDRPYLLVRLELKIQHGDQSSSLVQVAALPDNDDRRFLWTKRKVLDKQQLSRVDLDQVAEAYVAEEYATQELEQAGETAPQLNRIGILQAEGGLAKIIQSLLASFDFTDAQLGRMGKQGQLVWRLQGQWKPEKLARAAGKLRQEGNAATPLDPSRLPPHLPDQVVLHLRHEDLFPYRIEYRRTVSQLTNRSVESRSVESTTRTMVTMAFYDIVIDMPVSEQPFIYSPGGLEFTYDTADYLESLRTEK